MSDLIKRLIASGEMVLYHDYRSRSLRDWSGQGNDGVAVNTPKWGGGNIQLDDNSLQSIQVATAPEFNMSAFTLLMLSSGFHRSVLEASSGPGQHTFFSRYSGGAQVNVDFLCYVNYSGGNTNIQLADNTSSKYIAHNPTGRRLLAVNGTNGSTGALYSDGLLVGNLSGNNATFNSNNTQPIYIGNYSAAIGYPVPWSRIGIQAALIINRQLTATEHAQIYGELIAMNWESKPGRHAWRNTKPVNVSANTIAQYEMVARGTTVADVSGNGRNGTLCGNWNQVATPIGRGIRFHEYLPTSVGGTTGQAPRLTTSFTETTLHPANDALSVCCWQNRSTIGPTYNAFIIGKGLYDSSGLPTNGGLTSNVSSGQIKYASWNGSGYDILTGPSFQKNNYHHIGYTHDPATKLVTMFIDGEAFSPTLTYTAMTIIGTGNPWCVGGNGNTGMTSFNGTVAAPQFIKAIQDSTWWKEQYRAGAKAVQYAMGQGIETSLVASEGGVVGTYLSNSRWRFADATARVKVGIEQVNGQWLKTLEGVTAGYLYAPIESMLGNDAPNSSYGTWEWWQYKTDAGAITFAPVNTNAATPAAGTYYLEASATEDATLVEQGVGNVFSQAGAFTHSVWQKVRLTRGYAGRWRLYVNDSFVVEATDNTSYTTNHWLLNLGVGCKIAGLTKYLGDMSV